MYVVVFHTGGVYLRLRENQVLVVVWLYIWIGQKICIGKCMEQGVSFV